MDVFARITSDQDEQSRRRPELSPLSADLQGLPPSLLIAGTADPLLDDSRLLAGKLRSSGAEAELIEVEDAPHGFNRFPLRVAAIVNAYCRNWLLAQAAVGSASAAR